MMKILCTRCDILYDSEDELAYDKEAGVVYCSYCGSECWLEDVEVEE